MMDPNAHRNLLPSLVEEAPASEHEEAGPPFARLAIEEVMMGGNDGLLWLSLGFASAHNPLDVLHLACGTVPTGHAEADALYLERTDQDLACNGQVVRLQADRARIDLHLTAAGAAALQMAEFIRFDFSAQPELFAQTLAQLARMAAAGQACIALPSACARPAP